jgi:hypothetical protein
MKRTATLLIVLTALLIPTPAHSPSARAAAPKPIPLVSPEVMKQWNRVAICETGGNWKMHGSRYSGGIGFRNDVWTEYGGQKYAPHAGLATPEEQVLIARTIQARAGVPNFVPDQDGRCRGW